MICSSYMLLFIIYHCFKHFKLLLLVFVLVLQFNIITDNLFELRL